MKIITWNINGVRAGLKNGLLAYLEKEKPDVLCLQEIKISTATLEKEKIVIPEYNVNWYSAQRPGYSGTAILVIRNTQHITFSNGIGIDKFDSEGRVQTIEFDDFYLLNIYFPNANHELSRLDYKLEFNDALLRYAKNLEKTKPVVMCGDFNVAHRAIDLKNPKANEGSAGYTIEERRWFDELLRNDFADVYRHFYPEEIKYTWWSYRFQARAKNIGWRIDYFCVSRKLLSKIKSVRIDDQAMGSDHCPVIINF